MTERGESYADGGFASPTVHHPSREAISRCHKEWPGTAPKENEE